MKLDYNNVEIIELDLTTMCNARCPLCFRSQTTFPEKFKKPFFRSCHEILDQLKSFPNLRDVYLIGQMSEPTTHPEFIDLARALKSVGIHLRICSNGDLHDDNYWKDLGSILDDNDRVWFTLCGSTQAMHEHYRVGTTLHKILQHARALRTIKKVDGARALIFKYNENDIHSAEMKIILQQFSHYEFITTNFNADVHEDFHPLEEIATQYRKVDALASQMMKSKTTQIACQSIYEKQVQIDPFGGIWPCYVHFENMSTKCQSWNQDYQQILDKKNSCCRFCQNSILNYCQKHNIPDVI